MSTMTVKRVAGALFVAIGVRSVAAAGGRRLRGAPGIGRVGKETGYTYRFATRHPTKRGLY
jgi:hypothetical protein